MVKAESYEINKTQLRRTFCLVYIRRIPTIQKSMRRFISEFVTLHKIKVFENNRQQYCQMHCCLSHKATLTTYTCVHFFRCVCCSTQFGAVLEGTTATGQLAKMMLETYELTS